MTMIHKILSFIPRIGIIKPNTSSFIAIVMFGIAIVIAILLLVII